MSDLCPCCYRPLPPEMDLTVSLDENCVIWMGHRCDLTRTETEVAYALQKAGRQWVHMSKIIGTVYGGGDHPESTKNISVHMTRIRRKLREVGIPVTIESSWYCGGGGHQYRLKYGYEKFAVQ